ncbi:MAG: lactonase family protein [Planctomycetota bacterium]|nr:lactonase family protein [Planctomycetota bacterium]MDA1140149.1 lactonase family protein [Planctomycetota bacterium]
MSKQVLFIGNSTQDQGIFSCTLNTETGELSESKLAVEAPKPGFLAFHPSKPILYAVTGEDAAPNGGVRSFQINRDEGTLTQINQQLTGDNGATHLEADREGKALLVAHYSGGSTSSLPLNDDGSIGELAVNIPHQGSSAHERQKQPHAHGIAIDHQNRFACVADLGTDQVVVYRMLDGAHLEPASSWTAAPGSGPRHMAFHPNGKWLYCIHEINGTLSALAYNGKEGVVTEIGTYSTLPEDFTGENTTAEVVVHPNGKFVYGSNRGHDSTAVYAMDQETGALERIQIEPTLGGHPRHIGIDPTGTFFIAANRDNNNLVSFTIDQETGRLTPTGHQTSAPTPVCVVFLQ